MSQAGNNVRSDMAKCIHTGLPLPAKARKGCDSHYQVTVADISRGFTNAAKATGLWESDPPTFHEVRGLIINLLLRRGIDIRQVMELAAQSDPSVTSGYTANHPPEFVDLGIVVDEGVLG